MTTNSNNPTAVLKAPVIKVNSDFTNLKEVLLFCGVKEENIEEEIFFFHGGAGYEVEQSKTGPMISLVNLEDYWLFKKPDGYIHVMHSSIFEELFSIVKD